MKEIDDEEFLAEQTEEEKQEPIIGWECADLLEEIYERNR